MVIESGTVVSIEKEAKSQFPARNPIKWCIDAPKNDNVAGKLGQEELDQIGIRVVKEYEIDETSRREWKQQNEEGMVLAEQLLDESEAGAANVKYPLITVAAIQFSARALPELIPGTNIVKTKIIGHDPDGSKYLRGERISKHMSYQYLEEQEEWVEDMDRLLMCLPILGTYFKKTYFDKRLQRNVSQGISPYDVCINFKAKSMETAPRITHICTYYEYEVYEFVKSGIWLDTPILHTHLEPHQEPDEGRETTPHVFLEQHRRLDLDHDGYPEPYIVTVHKDTQKVVRIRSRWDTDGVDINSQTKKIVRIEPIHYFTKYGFLPNPRGGIYDIGFGLLLFPLNDTCNALINQLLDAGSQANLQAGFFGRGVRMQTGKLEFSRGEWKSVDTKDPDLRKSIFPLPVNEPSMVLFQLLGLLLDAGRDISSIHEVMTGKEPTSANVPATTVLMLVEQGTKVYNSIYKRVHRSLKKEFIKGYNLNAKYLPQVQYYRIMDQEQAIARADYNKKDLDIVPVSDPNMATDVQRMAKAQAEMAMSGRPNVNEDALTLRYLKAIKAEDIEEVLPPPDKRQPPPPDPKVLEITGKMEIESKKMMLEIEKFKLEQVRTMAEIEKIRAHAVEHIAKAEAQEIGPQLKFYAEQIKEIGAEARERIKLLGQTIKQNQQGQGGEGEKK